MIGKELSRFDKIIVGTNPTRSVFCMIRLDNHPLILQVFNRSWHHGLYFYTPNIAAISWLCPLESLSDTQIFESLVNNLAHYSFRQSLVIKDHQSSRLIQGLQYTTDSANINTLIFHARRILVVIFLPELEHIPPIYLLVIHSENLQSSSLVLKIELQVKRFIRIMNE